MKKLALGFGLLLLCANCVLAQAPLVSFAPEAGCVQHFRTQEVDLWLSSPDTWSLWAQAEPGLTFLDCAGNFVTKGKVLEGRGNFSGSHRLEVGFDLRGRPVGAHKFQLELSLKGAQGILGLPLPPYYWVLPLNNDDAWLLKEGDERLALASGQWFLLEEGDLLFSGEEQVFLGTRLSPLHLEMGECAKANLRWLPSRLSLQAGEEVEVALLFSGPQPAGTLVLQADPHLRLGEVWRLNGVQLDSRPGLDGSLNLKIPQLPVGEYELRGTFTALLPPQAKVAELVASWQGHEARLEAELGRSWFDFNQTQLVQTQSTKPTTILLPDGSLRSVEGNTKFQVKAQGLNVIITPDNPKTPLWLGFPLAESVKWELVESTGPVDEFVLPIFLWDNGFSWRVVAQNRFGFLDATRQRQLLHGQLGPIVVESSAGEISLANVQRATFQSGDWYWYRSSKLHSGTWRQGPWMVNLNIPHQDNKHPRLSVGYQGENWRVRLAPQNVTLSMTGQDWSSGFNLASHTVWAKLGSGFGIELKPGRLSLNYASNPKERVTLQIEQGSLQLQLTCGSWQSYLKSGQQGTELGLRFKQGHSKERWLFLTRGAAQAKSDLFLLELQQQLGYCFTPWCTLYLEGCVSSSFPRGKPSRIDLNYGTGVVFTPLPQMIASLGWNKQQGWHWQAGVAIPLIGRKNPPECE